MIRGKGLDGQEEDGGTIKNRKISYAAIIFSPTIRFLLSFISFLLILLLDSSFYFLVSKNERKEMSKPIGKFLYNYANK